MIKYIHIFSVPIYSLFTNNISLNQAWTTYSRQEHEDDETTAFSA